MNRASERMQQSGVPPVLLEETQLISCSMHQVHQIQAEERGRDCSGCAAAGAPLATQASYDACLHAEPWRPPWLRCNKRACHVCFACRRPCP